MPICLLSVGHAHYAIQSSDLCQVINLTQCSAQYAGTGNANFRTCTQMRRQRNEFERGARQWWLMVDGVWLNGISYLMPADISIRGIAAADGMLVTSICDKLRGFNEPAKWDYTANEWRNRDHVVHWRFPTAMFNGKFMHEKLTHLYIGWLFHIAFTQFYQFICSEIMAFFFGAKTNQPKWKL